MAVNKKGGLGKGLDALFLDNSTEEKGGSVTVNINDIEPNRDQPRKDFDEEALRELADSIALVDTPRVVHLPTQEMVSSGNIERLFNSDAVSFDAISGAIRLRR